MSDKLIDEIMMDDSFDFHAWVQLKLAAWRGRDAADSDDDVVLDKAKPQTGAAQ